MSNLDLVAYLLIQLIAILTMCKLVSYLGRKVFGQTEVVCEMIAGVVLGPSLLGYLAPDLQSWLFPIHPALLMDGTQAPNTSMAVLHVLGQMGLIFYMFIVGSEFDQGLIKKKLNGITSIVIAATLVPFILGAALTYLLIDKAEIFEPAISIPVAACFLGICMAITAFPMLARILQERGLESSSVGTISLASGSICDAISWSLLAFLLAVVKADKVIAITAIAGSTLFFCVMVFFVRKLLALFFANYSAINRTRSLFIYKIIFLLFSAWLTNYLGIYPIFGAFIAGAIMPRSKPTADIREKMEPLTTKVLLPLFFVYSGLNTEIQLINTETLWIIVGLIILTAIAGKLLSCSLTARLSGETWRDSMTIGALMNARGLMELIVLNIGLSYKIITPVMFSILTLMAIITTLMTSYLFNAINSKSTKLLSGSY